MLKTGSAASCLPQPFTKHNCDTDGLVFVFLLKHVSHGFLGAIAEHEELKEVGASLDLGQEAP